ncbi:MAG TPA: hypothetical protein VI198_01905 [Candidatus Eisenbacteria bacterium]
MKALKFTIPALVLSLAAAGCILVSGQFLIDVSLDNFTTTSQTAVTRQDVDLNTESDYVDHKDELKSIADIAVLGKITNNGSGPIGVEVWMTPGPTTFNTSTEVSNGATKLWGPLVVLPGAANAKTIDWNKSAALFTAAGKTMLLNEVKGDGQFTLYAIGNETTYSVTVENGVLALVLEFAK